MNQKILIAIDLSENSLKAVDYVGSIVACHATADITMLNIIKEPSEDTMPAAEERKAYLEKTRADTLALMEAASSRLTAHGIPEGQIHLKIQICKKPISVAELILHERKQEDYGTIVIGRRGMSKKEEFLFGSVSNRIVREAKNCAVWVIE